MAQVGQVVDIFSNKAKPGEEGKPSDVAAQGTVPQQPNVLPPDYNDPAYTAVGTVADVASILLAILTSGENGGVDWEGARAKPGEKNQSAGYAVSMLEFALKQFKPSNRPPSQKYVAALKKITQVNLYAEFTKTNAKAKQVAKDFKTAVDNKSKMGGKEVDAATVEKWQTTVQDAVDEFTVLQTTADSISRSTVSVSYLRMMDSVTYSL